MKQFRVKIRIILFLLLYLSGSVAAQKAMENQISDSLTAIVNVYTRVGKVNLLEFSVKSSKVTIVASDKLSFMPFRPDNVQRIYSAITKIISPKYLGYTVVCVTDKRSIEDLIPNFYRTGAPDYRKQFGVVSITQPLVSKLSRPYKIENGLTNRNIALWPSHGWYYDVKKARWSWQRARVFQIVEDLYPMSFVLPYIAPMLENAGATTFLPRERDTQVNELIVDNDTKSLFYKYREHNDRKGWKVGEGVGFANPNKTYVQGENPFTMGTYHLAESVSDSDDISTAEWYPNIPVAGRYAVYVSYKSFENSVTDAHYTVYYNGGKSEFLVNQTMCGGTWVYLGHFYFDKGKDNQIKVVLSNFSSETDKIVTADAVKFGGGMGNIARSPLSVATAGTARLDSAVVQTEVIQPGIYPPEVSSYPRFAEAARYWLQWAGIPDSIYNKNKGKNDYTDDVQSRGNWVNYLAGGSTVMPSTQGLKVPLDLSFGFHTDAGYTANDSIIGTLGICTVTNSDGKTEFKNGVSRWASRDLTDIIQTEIINDIRTDFAPEWTRRGLWNRSYSESRVPEVPAMLLELLSHQNFADMRYGLDPRFRFTVSRSIYKGMLKYLAATNQQKYVVQPLPVEQFSCRFIAKNKLELHWVGVMDAKEPTATPDNYVLYTRVGDGGFDNGVVVNSNRVTVSLKEGKIYSFKIAALNSGGESFPSEILSACRLNNTKPEVLVVNGFDRVSAPSSFVLDSTMAGFMIDDVGVPDKEDISFVGSQYEFKRSAPWKDDDAPGFGGSYANYETKVIAGNSFDYPYLHGRSIMEAGFSFVSCSQKSVLMGDIDLNQYKIVDLVLGKQKQTTIGNGKKAVEFKTFPLALQQVIQSYCSKGGSLFVSGAYIGSDLCDGENKLPADKRFVEDVLKYKFRTRKASVSGNVKIVSSPYPVFKKIDFAYYDTPNDVSYYVESPDAIEPVGVGAYSICRYSENNASAAVAYAGSYKTCAFGFPFEAIDSEKDRNVIMASVLSFLNPVIATKPSKPTKKK